MVEWLFPTWSTPLLVAALVGARLCCNAVLTATVAAAVGPRTVHTAVAGGLTLLSGALTVLLLRPSGLGLAGSYVELGCQAALLAVAGSVAYSVHGRRRRVVTVGALLVATGLLIVMIPVYGERFVAP